MDRGVLPKSNICRVSARLVGICIRFRVAFRVA